MKQDELRELLEICNDHRVASFEQDGKRLKVVFYEGERDAGSGMGLDNEPDDIDSSDRSPRPVQKPAQPEGPYPASIFPDGEAPTFGD